ncbi:mucolipin-3-like isoform X2 [Dreissena polymorpha]|uniref:mucolipin-3-like isoform X2 n=1 Tax=Dreissena polymorpha TaxID=45954 RepID=UPI00226513A3|nr:mucolipin-3-like isoform X2 [Dreissena polymorpha]
MSSDTTVFSDPTEFLLASSNTRRYNEEINENTVHETYVDINPHDKPQGGDPQVINPHDESLGGNPQVINPHDESLAGDPKKRKDFMQLLRDTPWVQSRSSWKVTKDALNLEKRIIAAKDIPFEDWFNEFRQYHKRQDFMQLLNTTPEVNSRSSWTEARKALEADERFGAFKDEALLGPWFDAFIHDRKRQDFMQLLRDTTWVQSKSSWIVTQDALKWDKRYTDVGDENLAYKWFNEFRENLLPCRIDEMGGNNASLKFWICLLVFSPFKWYHGTLWISIPHMIVFGIHLAKLVVTTISVFSFGGCRVHVSDTITHGQLAIKHNLLKGWSAEYETIPFPPSIGPFAVYSVEDLIDRINFAVEGYYNMEYLATGHFKILPIDQIDINFRYINVADSILEIRSSSLVPNHGLKNVTENGHVVFKYNVLTDLEKFNLTDVFNSIFDVTVTASLHTFCVLRNSAVICQQIQINVCYSDSDFNGEVGIELNTTTTTVACQRMNLKATDDAVCERNANEHLSVITLTSVTSVFDVMSIAISIAIGISIMRCHYHTENVTNFGSYILRWWSLVSLIGDIFIFIGEILLHNENKKRSGQKLRSFDAIAFFYGIGCLLCWIGFMRYLKIHRKFSLLFHTIYHAKSNILAFVLCTGILFTAYWACAFVILGVYHPKFETQGRAAASLSALLYADDIFGTVTSVHYEHAGNEDWLIASIIIVIYSFVFLFTLLGLNLIISLINTSYTTLNETEYKGDCTTLSKGTVSMFYFLNGEETQKGHEGIGIGTWLFGKRFYYRLTWRILEYLKT